MVENKEVEGGEEGAGGEATSLSQKHSSRLKSSFASTALSCAQEWGLCREKILILHLNCL